MNFNEGDFATFNGVSNDGHQSELHHGSVGIEEHGLRHDDAEVVAVKGHAKVAVTGVGFEQSNDLFLLSFNDLDHLEGILQGLTGHGMVVIDASTASSQVRELTLPSTDVHRSADVEGVGVLDRTNQFVNADGFDLLGVLFAVGFSRFNDDLDLFVGFCISQCSLKAGDEVARADNTHHGAVRAAFLVHLVLFCDGFSSGLDQIAAFAVVQLIINVDNCSFFHSLASKG